MLVLTRRVGEEVRIGEDIIVRLAKIMDNDRVRLGIIAPKHVKVMRTELLEPHDGAPADTQSEPRQFMNGARG